MTFAGTRESGDWQVRSTAALRFAAAHGFLAESVECGVDDPRLVAVIESLEQQKAAGGPVFERDQGIGVVVRGFGVHEPKVRVKHAQGEGWYMLLGDREIKDPSRAPTTLHLGWLDDDKTRATRDVASPEFLERVDKAALSGLERLPIELSKPGESRPWCQVYASTSLGRGLDHPLVDPLRTMESSMKERRRRKWDISRRRGMHSASASDLRASDSIGHKTLRRYHELLGRWDFSVRRDAMYVREHLPPQAFAYVSWTWDPDPLPGPFGRSRTLACSGLAREALLAAGLLKASAFQPLRIVAAADADAVILDREIAEPMPPPSFTPAEAAIERARRQAIIDAKAPPGAGPRIPSVDEIVAQLEARLAGADRPWTPAREDPCFASVVASELWPRTPLSWRRIAPLLPLRIPEPAAPGLFRWEIVPPTWNEWVYEGASGDESASTKDLVLATSCLGDWYAVRPTKRPAKDMTITLWDHETTTIEDQWSSVAGIVEHVEELIGGSKPDQAP